MMVENREIGNISLKTSELGRALGEAALALRKQTANVCRIPFVLGKVYMSSPAKFSEGRENDPRSNPK